MIHPVAWWAWGVGLATAAAHTTNPLLLVLVVLVAGWAVLERREVGALDAFRPFLFIGLAAVALRVTMAVILGNGVGGSVVIVDLPRLPLPSWLAGLRVGGPVTLESVLAAAVDGMRLAATLACIGAANALASPKRLLRYAPATLYDIGTAIVVALTFAPQLVELAGRVRVARRLRGHTGRGPRELARLVVPVLAGTLERSLELAASMESRGYGRLPVRTGRARWLGSILALVGTAGTCAGLYGLLSPSVGGWLGLPTLVAGVALAAASLVLGARREVRTAYRRDPWRAPEWALALAGAAAAGVFVVGDGSGWAGMALQSTPLAWPELPLLAAAPLAVCLSVIALTPVPPRLAAARARTAAAA